MIYKNIAAILMLILAAGCTTFSPDGGIGAVNDLTRSRIQHDATWIRSEKDSQAARAATRELLAKPLSADDAVKVALLNNRGLQAAYSDLGIGEADVVQAGRLRNPGFSFTRLRRADEIEIERTFLIDVLGLVTMPLRSDLEKRRFALTQGRVAAEVLQTAADTRRAWYAAVAAQESETYMAQVKQAAEASAELARRMTAAGNFSKLDHAREQVFYAEAAAQLARAQQNAVSQREQLTRLMGLWGEDTTFRIPGRLPTLPKTARDIRDLETKTISSRLDVKGAMQEAENLAATLGLTRATGFINVFEVGYQRNSASNQPRQTGYEIELRLPIFDWGGAKVARAEHTYMQAVHRAADIAVRARSEVREAYSAYRTAFDLAQHYRDEIVPLRKHISEEVLLRYNGNLMSVFELLADARQQIAAVSATIDAQRDFWLAETALNLALTGKSPGVMALTAGSAPMSGAAAEH
ncbi:MAG: TolC family protein [Burkholderiales bacterium]